MRICDFDYHLPPELIAQTPVEPRDQSRLMVLTRDDGIIKHHQFSDITHFLRAGDVMVFNDSRVIPARLAAYNINTGGKFEVFLLRFLEPCVWETLVRPAKRAKAGTKVAIISKNDFLPGHQLDAQVIDERENGIRIIRFSNDELVLKLGSIPLPPYIHTNLSDPERYQTVYSRENGSVAAPTAGLHFTSQLLNDIKSLGVEMAFITLHIGLGTFQPVREEDPLQHKMHSEYYELSAAVAAQIAQAKREGRRIICVGTTTVRTLEQASANWNDKYNLEASSGWTELFIFPGYKFRIVDVLLTNFHLPRSTLLMLVSAFANHDFLIKAYQEAIEQHYRFYSFGDAMLIF